MKKQLIKEDGWDVFLGAVGFVPVFGEIADFIQIIRYYRRGEYIYCALTAVALVPAIGDIVAKPIILFFKSFKDVKNITTTTKGVSQIAKSGDEIANAIKQRPKIKNLLEKFIESSDSGYVKKIKDNIASIPKIGDNLVKGVDKGINQLKVIAKKAGVKSNKISDDIANTSMSDRLAKARSGANINTLTTPKYKYKGIKSYFLNKEIARYVEKHGKNPSWFMRNIVLNYLSSWKRRNQLRKFIVANRILESLNFPNIESLDRALRDDPNIGDKLLQNDALRQYIENNASSDEIKYAMGQTQSDDDSSDIMSKASSVGNLFFGLQFLKTVAKRL